MLRHAHHPHAARGRPAAAAAVTLRQHGALRPLALSALPRSGSHSTAALPSSAPAQQQQRHHRRALVRAAAASRSPSPLGSRDSSGDGASVAAAAAGPGGSSAGASAPATVTEDEQQQQQQQHEDEEPQQRPPSVLAAAISAVVSGIRGDSSSTSTSSSSSVENNSSSSSSSSRAAAPVSSVMTPFAKGQAPPPPPQQQQQASSSSSSSATDGAVPLASTSSMQSVMSMDEEPTSGTVIRRSLLSRARRAGLSPDAAAGGSARASPSGSPSSSPAALGQGADAAAAADNSARDDLITLLYAMGTGVVVAGSVFAFDVSIQYIHDLPDILAQIDIGGGRAVGLQLPGDVAVPFRCVMPVGAGFAVAALARAGFAPGLKFLTRAIEGVVDDSKTATLPQDYGQVLRKAAASAITLGSGASLGPEAPSVELGANTAAVLAPKSLSKRRQRMLVAAGAAAGVSAAFDAPTSGALFAVEFVLKSSRLGLDRLSTSTVFASTSVAAGVVGFLRSQGRALGVAGAGGHLVGRIPYFSVQPNLLIDVLQFSALGVACAGAAVLLYEGVRIAETAMRPLPRWAAAPLGGALCGAVALKFPAVQYGYTSLEEIFRDESRATVGDLSALLLAKLAATSACAGSGLVGGLFQPSLFLGALVGDIASHVVGGRWGVVDPTTFAVVGAAAVLGAACRAPLTAIALMVEITRDVGLLVPLLAAIGVASLVAEYGEGVLGKQLDRVLASGFLSEASAFWGARNGDDGGAAALPAATVEDIISTPARLYVRHTLPLEQARAALVARNSPAAVVVDDAFNPLGVVTLDDIEAEAEAAAIELELLNQSDGNFDRRPFL